MKHFKKIIAVVLSVLLVMSFCACEMHEKNETVVTVGNTVIGSELYIMYLMQADSEFKSGVDTAISEAGGTAISATEDYYDQTLDSKDADTWIADKTMEYCKEYAWTTETFVSLGLTLDEEQTQAVDSYVYTYWDYYGNSETYEGYGISKEAFRLYWEQLVKKEAIFNYYYDEGGVEEVSKDDIFKNITENYIQADTITMSKLDENSAALTGDALTKVQEQAQGYVDRFNNGEATIGELNAEYTGEDDKETTSSTTSSTESESAEQTSSDTASENTSSTTEEEEEIVSIYEDAMFFSADDSDKTVYEKLKEIIAAEDFVGYGKAAYFETDSSIIVYVVRDMSADKEYVMDTYKVNALHNLKDDAFAEKLTAGMNALTVTTESSISRYKAENFLEEE